MAVIAFGAPGRVRRRRNCAPRHLSLRSKVDAAFRKATAARMPPQLHIAIADLVPIYPVEFHLLLQHEQQFVAPVPFQTLGDIRTGRPSLPAPPWRPTAPGRAAPSGWRIQPGDRKPRCPPGVWAASWRCVEPGAPEQNGKITPFSSLNPSCLRVGVTAADAVQTRPF